MKSRRFEIVLAAAMFAVFLGFFLWQTPGLWQGALTSAEVDRYAAALERHLAMPPTEKAAFIGRVREWAAADDGRPVMLVNLLRYRERLGALPPALDFRGSPQETNAHYERLVAPLAVKRGEYPLLGGAAQGRSLTVSDAAVDRWDRVVVMRAPSRRAFIEFMADPDYGPTVPYKVAATDVVLIPIDAELSVPDLRWLVGGLLLTLYLLIGWRRATRAPD